MSLAPRDAFPMPEIFITIRFSAPALSDLTLPIPSPTTTTTAGLKQLIRQHLPPDLSNHRLRLIHAGKALSDNALLSASVRTSTLQPTTPRALAPSDPNDKGKAPVHNHPPEILKTYIHCSIGDVILSPADLKDEAAVAFSLGDESSHATSDAPHPTTSTVPAPRGFDRLLSAGFAPAEVTSLRSQFLAIQAQTHTPDTMPTAAELRDLEERWLDNENGANGGTGITEDEAGAEAELDDLVWGVITGFFWPIGSVFWGVREEGIWSWRRKRAVVVGVMINFAFGIVSRYLS